MDCATSGLADNWISVDPFLSPGATVGRPEHFVLVSRLLEGAMSETRKLAAILVSDVVGYSRFAGGADWGACLQRLLACALLVLKRAVPMRERTILRPGCAPASPASRA